MTPIAARTFQTDDYVIFDDALAAGWQNWSWSSTIDFAATTPLHGGSNALAVTFDEAWAGLYLRSDAPLTYATLSFWIWGSGQTIGIFLYDEPNNYVEAAQIAPPAGTWTPVEIPLSGMTAPIWGIGWLEIGGGPQPTFFLDDIHLTGPSTAPTAATAQPPASIDTPRTVLPVYEDALADGWENWGWDSTLDFASTELIHSGSAALAVTFDAAWAGLYLHSRAAISPDFEALRFWIWGNGQTIGVYLYDQNNEFVEAAQINPPLNTWTQVDVPLSVMAGRALFGIGWIEINGTAQARFFLDDIQFISSRDLSAIELGLVVDVTAVQHPISPYIYGMNYADPVLAADIGLPVHRWGGNATTRYNWQNDTANRAFDWYFENIAEDTANPAALPDGSSANRFIEQNTANGTATLLTVPLIGWTPTSRDMTCGFSIEKYGPQQDFDPYRPDCGNGVLPDGTIMTGNDPTDTSTAIGPEFVQAWIEYLIARYGTAAEGGVQFYNLDNEPSLWNSTHRDVHPEPLSYDELRDRTYAYAPIIKATDPTALTLGPVDWGWPAYFYSALDLVADPEWWANPVDRNAHGGVPLVAWYLQQMRLYEEQHGVRILDYLDLHYYPQANGVSLSPVGDATTQSLRLRTTRSLWDPTYMDESWIAEPVMLIPRMKAWIEDNYPGTRIAISEYNFGGLEDINGALAQADVLGIFGREGVDFATMWGPPTADQPGAFAFHIYRNYDGAGSTFGDSSVQATSTDQARLSIYAALRSDGALTILLINKSTAALNSPLTINGFDAATAEVYRYSAADLTQIVRQDDLTISNSLTVECPAASMTLLVIPAQ